MCWLYMMEGTFSFIEDQRIVSVENLDRNFCR